MSNYHLNRTCYTIESGKIKTGTLNDFKHFIEESCRPAGVMPKYYTTDTNSCWAVAKYESGEEIILWEFDSKRIADERVMEMQVGDILCNNDHPIYTNLAKAEEALVDFY